jgi:hypothetical protein
MDFLPSKFFAVLEEFRKTAGHVGSWLTLGSARTLNSVLSKPAAAHFGRVSSAF